MTVDEAMQKGEVATAVALLEQELAPQPQPEAGALFMLFELKAVLEDFDGAERALDQIVKAQPAAAPMMDEMRACIRADRERKARRSPGASSRRGLGMPPPFHLAGVKAAVLFANGDVAGAAAAVAEARAMRPRVAGTLQRRGAPAPVPFDDIADSDDLIGGSLEVVGPSGVLDVCFAELASIVFAEPRGYQDTLWLPVTLHVRDGRKLPARLFALYSGSGTHAVPSVRLGQMTLWDRSSGIAIGYGQRDLKLTSAGGESMTGIRQVVRIDFAGTPSTSTAKDTDGAKPGKPGFFKRLFG